MRVVATADLHGYITNKIPKCDLLLIAGDVCPAHDHSVLFQFCWLNDIFGPWVNGVPARHVIGTWGNHDWVGQNRPSMTKAVPWHCLVDEVGPYYTYGVPWTRTFNNWAFNLDEPALDDKFRAIPSYAEIIVSHGPPYGYGDKTQSGEHIGSRAFLDRIDEIQPKLVVFGHNHSEPGVWTRNGTILANVTMVNDAYQKAYEPRVFDV